MKKIITCLLLTGCSSGVSKPVKDAGIKIAEDVCKELAQDAASPDVVTLECTAGAEIAKILLPRKAWLAAKASSVDAGPGK